MHMHNVTKEWMTQVFLTIRTLGDAITATAWLTLEGESVPANMRNSTVNAV